MKKLFFLLTVITTVSTHAQKTQFGFTGGATFANYKSNYDGTNQSGNSKTGFTIGAMANIAAGKSFVIQPAINWVQKGTTDEQTFDGHTEKVSLTTNNIELPVNFMYSHNGFFIGAGPSFSFAVSGKINVEADGTKENEKLNFGNSDTDAMKSFDFGANAVTGYQFKGGVFIAANYNLGLSNLASGSDPNKGSLKSGYFGIKLGYLLGGKGK